MTGFQLSAGQSQFSPSKAATPSPGLSHPHPEGAGTIYTMYSRVKTNCSLPSNTKFTNVLAVQHKRTHENCLQRCVCTVRQQ